MPPTSPSVYSPTPPTVTAPATFDKFRKAILQTNLAGADNDLVITAKTGGIEGNDISFAIAAPVAGGVTTTAAKSGKKVTVTPGTKARMQIGGTLTSDGSTPVVFPEQEFTYVDNGKPRFAFMQNETSWNGSQWNIYAETVMMFYSEEDVATPDLVTTWTPVGAATGTPVVTALTSSADQGKKAIEADTASAALVDVAIAGGGAGAGALAVFAETHLSGGTGKDPADTPVVLPLTPPSYVAVSGITSTPGANGPFAADESTKGTGAASWTRSGGTTYVCANDGTRWGVFVWTGSALGTCLAATDADGFAWNGDWPWNAPAESWEIKSPATGAPRVTTAAEAPVVLEPWTA